MTTRRDVLRGAAAVASVAVLPPMPMVSTAVAAAPTAEPLLAFMVGTPGEFDGAFVRARNIKEAFEIWGEEQGHMAGSDECENCYDPQKPDAPCSCDPAYYALRMEQWDNLKGEPSGGDWLDAGLGYICDRCNYETFSGDGYNVNGDAICTDCMTLADWKVVDPEHYAEEVDQLLTDEYGPDIRFPEYW